jgi:TolA-binding protein
MTVLACVARTHWMADSHGCNRALRVAGMRTQQLAAARLKTLHQQASTRLEAMQAEILRQKQQRVMMQRQLREQQKEKRREHAEHLKVLPAFVLSISIGDSWGRMRGQG